MYLDYYSHDGLGSVATLTHYEDDENHQPIRYRYSAFGAIVRGDFTNNPYGYTSRRFDHENGFYHYHFRKYDPVTGNWLTADPIGIAGGINLYRFVSNNPVNYRDWLGLEPNEGEEGYDDMTNNGWGIDGEADDYGDPGYRGIEGNASDAEGWGLGVRGGILGFFDRLFGRKKPIYIKRERKLITKYTTRYGRNLTRITKLSEKVITTAVLPGAGIPTPVKGVWGAAGLIIGEMVNPSCTACDPEENNSMCPNN
jgi:RHS repeat-associated protein